MFVFVFVIKYLYIKTSDLRYFPSRFHTNIHANTDGKFLFLTLLRNLKYLVYIGFWKVEIPFFLVLLKSQGHLFCNLQNPLNPPLGIPFSFLEHWLQPLTHYKMVEVPSLQTPEPYTCTRTRHLGTHCLGHHVSTPGVNSSSLPSYTSCLLSKLRRTIRHGKFCRENDPEGPPETVGGPFSFVTEDTLLPPSPKSMTPERHRFRRVQFLPPVLWGPTHTTSPRRTLYVVTLRNRRTFP